MGPFPRRLSGFSLALVLAACAPVDAPPPSSPAAVLVPPPVVAPPASVAKPIAQAPAGSPAGLPYALPAPAKLAGPPRRVVDGKVEVRGITDDGLVVYREGDRLMAAPVGGGAPALVAYLDPHHPAEVRVDGRSVVIESLSVPTDPSYVHSVWTAASGRRALLGLVARSDEHRMVYSTPDGSVARVFFGADADGSSPHELFRGLEHESVAVELRGRYAVFAVDVDQGNGARRRDVVWFDDGWVKKGASTDVAALSLDGKLDLGVSTDTASTVMLTLASDRRSWRLQRLDGSGGFDVRLARKVEGAFLSEDGKTVFTYDEASVDRYPASPGARPSAVVTRKPHAHLRWGALASDRRHAIVDSWDTRNAGGGAPVDPGLAFSALVSLSGARAPLVVSRYGKPSRLEFTRDGRALVGVESGATPRDEDVIYAIAVDTGARRELGPAPFGRRNTDFLLGAGARVGWVGAIGNIVDPGHFNPLGNDPYFDIVTVDLATDRPPSVLVYGVSGLLLTADGTALVYQHTQPGSEGVYVAPLP